MSKAESAVDAPHASNEPHAGRTPATALLAILLVIGIGAGITRTDLLWGETAFEHAGGSELVFAQCYQTARAIHRGAASARDEHHVALLGNSRLIFPVHEPVLEDALQKALGGAKARVSELGVFGADFNALGAIARNLPTLDPDVVVFGASGADLYLPPDDPMRQLPARLLGRGFRAAPNPESLGTRVDRALRTLWPLYRYREFARSALLDRVLGRAKEPPRAVRYRDTAHLFSEIRPERAARVERAFQSWQRAPSFHRYEAYLRTGHGFHLKSVRDRVTRFDATLAEQGTRALEDLLSQLEAGAWRSIVILLPENPALRDDREHRYHLPDPFEAGSRRVAEAARRHGIPVIDARAWHGAADFLDFDHLLPTLSDFDTRLAREIQRVLAS